MKAEMLAARANRLRNILSLGSGHHEDDVRRRLFQGLEQRVESRVSDLVGLVKDVNLVTIARRAIAGRVAQLADLVNAAVGRRVNLNHVDRASRAYLDAGFADAARIGGRPVRGAA